MSSQEPAYELAVSRIFNAPPSAVRQAFTDPEQRTKWLSEAGRPIPDPSAEDGLLTWTEQLGPSGGTGTASSARSVRVELRDESPGRTLLELRASPYSKVGEMDARAWWDSAFSHLDTVLERNSC